jgi:hypothetical protein
MWSINPSTGMDLPEKNWDLMVVAYLLLKHSLS